MVLACVLIGCASRVARHNSSAGAPSGEGYKVPLQRAIEEISKIRFFSVTNGNYKLAIKSGRNGSYVFTFDLLDYPDLTIIASVSSNRVLLKGGWFPEEGEGDWFELRDGQLVPVAR